MTSITLQIEILSDWRIGSGTGRPGDIDHLIRRDEDGLPFLPSKTLTGVWRDGCELVAAALDGDVEQGPWWQWVNYLFGSQPNQDNQPEQAPIPAHLSVQSARFPQEFCDAIAHKPLLLEALTFTKPGIEIDAKSGSAKDKCFRLEEVARGGITLTSSCRFSEDGLSAEQQEISPEQQQALAKALLAAGAAMVERVGNKRRRGAGRCRFSLQDYELKDAHDYLHEHRTPLPVPGSGADAQTEPVEQAEQAEQVDVVQTDAHQSKSWHCITLTITAQQPLVISRATVGNVVETLDYVPGSYLLPIVARQLNNWGLSRASVGAAIADGQLVVTNAYRSEKGQRGMPTPFALFKEKVDRDDITYNRLFETSETAQLKQCRGGYVTHVTEVKAEQNKEQPEAAQTQTELAAQQQFKWQQHTISTGIETHNTVNDKLQRPDSSVGGVYSYQAIPTGTSLQAELRFSPTLWAEVKDQTSWEDFSVGRHSLGRSRKDEYGSVAIVAAETPAEKSAPSSSGGAEQSEAGSDDGKPAARLTVWCVSDILLRDAWLRPTTDPMALASALSAALKLDLPLRFADFQSAAKTRNLFARHSRIDSWQTRWGLARPSLVGIKAGSCFVFELPIGMDCVEQAKLTAVERTGIGERRVEGFGQVRLNPALLKLAQPGLSKPETDKHCLVAPQSHSISLSSELESYAQRVEKEAWRSAIRRVSLAIASDPVKRKSLLGFDFDQDGNSQPSLTQLGGLRSQLMQLHSQSLEDSNARTWLTALKKAGKWKVGKTDIAANVLHYLGERIEKKPDIWETLDLEQWLGLPPGNAPLEDWLTLGTGRAAQLKADLWAEAVETFLSACIRAHKRDAEAKQKKSDQQEEQIHG